ncbi:MAG: MarR family transcriptional regulator [Ilumatobacteraceae bacterium]|nr:MarR family transcriptional regulator [Ilumatobacteraceae bacterium]
MRNDRDHRDRDRDDLGEAWQLLAPLFLARRDAFFAALRELGLNPPHGQGLMSLANGPVRMRDLAEVMTCDASYVTSIVDRLTELGYAIRQESPTDRRVREVALTAHGRTVTERLQRLFTEPPLELQRLSVTDRAALVRILRKLPAVSAGPWSAIRRSR